MNQKRLVVIIIALTSLLAAFNTGKNLLYLLFVLLLTLIMISSLLPAISLWRIRLNRKNPSSADQHLPVVFSLTLQNEKLLSGYMIRITEKGSNEPLAFLPTLLSRERKELFFTKTYIRRGLQTLPTLAITSNFPFGFFEKKIISTDSHQILVYPSYEKIRSLPPILVENPESTSQTIVKKPGEGLSFLYIREYRPEDGLRRIHWPSSAKRGKLMVKEYEQDGKYRYVIALQPNPGSLGEERFELGVRAAATLTDYVMRRSYPIYIVPDDTSTIQANPFRTGAQFIREMMKTLALARIQPTIELRKHLEPCTFLFQRGALLIVFLFQVNRRDIDYLEEIAHHGARIAAIYADPLLKPSESFPSEFRRASILTSTIRAEQDMERLRFEERL